MKSYNIDTIDFTTALPVVSGAAKFVLPVPNFGEQGDPLVFPVGHEKAGEAITDYKGRPIGDRGIVFFNAVDNVVQAAPGDGTAIIIVNQVTSQAAEDIAAKVREFNTDPNQLTLPQLKQVLEWLYSRGHKDFYNSDTGFLAKSLSRLGAAFVNESGEIPNFGLYKRDARDVCSAVRVNGPAEVAASAAEPTRFDVTGVILKHGDAVRAIQLQQFIETYRKLDGSPIQEDEIPVLA